ncbi:MAG: zinc metallopeptidase, partial [Pirellulales bacterium]
PNTLILVGLGAFGLTVAVQLINLPVEFDASARAKRQLVELGVIDQQGLAEVSRVLGAAAWTYVAATLQTVMTLLYYVSIFAGGDRRR